MSLRRLHTLFDGLEKTVANLSLALLVGILAMQVFFRYVLHSGLTWSEEISRFCFIWFVYISASLAAQKGTHIRVTIATHFFPGGQRACLLVADGVWVAFNAFVVASGVMLINKMIAHPVYSTALFLPMVWVYSVIPLAHALMILRIVQRQWTAWRTGTSVLPEGQDG
ncbi:MAG: TRAP transporter small permease [Hyphomicrobiales bacterium]|nr:TRAP transporter small permease [Hyphomicrobiales bacterium]MCP5373406.1 TRAP transporter small permease [Hyphomicrobiales bacterium]